jgi:hypothetical protein
MTLKEFIFQKARNYKFKKIKVSTDLKAQELKSLVGTKNVGLDDFLKLCFDVEKNNLSNLVFFLRVLDFRLWEFPQNWHYKNRFGFYGLLERVKDLINHKNLKHITFSDFKKIISPFESKNLSYLRYKIFAESFFWLNKKWGGFFDNYFKKNKKPLNFCINLFELRKFRDYEDNFYFLKPNQLLYEEYIMANKLEKDFKKELEQLTIFADYKIVSLFLKMKLLDIPTKKIDDSIVIKKGSLLEKELRWGSIIIGEKISQLLNKPSYKVDNSLWFFAHNSYYNKKIDLPLVKVKTIFY